MGILWGAVQRSCFPSLIFVGLGLLRSLSEWGGMLLADRRFVFFCRRISAESSHSKFLVLLLCCSAVR